ncbi:MAG: 2'-5' RNA ligase family protein [Microcystis aeruginosa Ma_MB_S_20031200_S102]|uniref:2'-5' RNA ligase family protein n=1 Tax=Microcystis aeruginosa Ma_MB_S_20031200_S102 TaxID=2486254 RepID=A0A552EAD4_MICAE|nr:MAG: 2'-5' RNA ligase family protein [Microcystis aeruginosa Ma_MB_S_20031200_S102D]TRU31466.1 MAG: 2'-5' RNA ligase family protein [Microcystis aeruginosa Ma_MB_S_20031200_S102]
MLAILPNHTLIQQRPKIKLEFAEIYNSRAALKSPPHVTLQPPFRWNLGQLPDLERCLEEFARLHSPIPLILQNFAAFKPRVIYINVQKTPELLTLQKQLLQQLESSLNISDNVSKSRAFAPHLTVGFRDLTKDNFWKAWSKYANQELFFEVMIDEITLLIHNGKHWEIYRQFSL